MAVLFVLFDDWLKRRQMLAALGVEAIDVLEDALTPQTTDTATTDPEVRRRQVEAFVAVAGGE